MVQTDLMKKRSPTNDGRFRSLYRGALNATFQPPPPVKTQSGEAEAEEKEHAGFGDRAHVEGLDGRTPSYKRNYTAHLRVNREGREAKIVCGHTYACGSTSRAIHQHKNTVNALTAAVQTWNLRQLTTGRAWKVHSVRILGGKIVYIAGLARSWSIAIEKHRRLGCKNYIIRRCWSRNTPHGRVPIAGVPIGPNAVRIVRKDKVRGGDYPRYGQKCNYTA